MYTEKSILVEMVYSRWPTLGLYSNPQISLPTTNLKKNNFPREGCKKNLAITPP